MLPRNYSPWIIKWPLMLITLFGFLILYIPITSLVVDSFRDSRNLELGPHWTLNWYRQIFQNPQVLISLKTSLIIGMGSTIFSTVFGTLAAIVLTRTRFVGRKVIQTLIYVPLIMPEIVLGLSLLIWFVMLKMTLGIWSVTLAHVTFSMSYVIITVKACLENFDDTLEEAARDLGATSWKTFWKVTFPLIWPGILGGALMAFTLSFDDFLITFFTSGVNTDTLPLKIYSMIKYGVTPEISALSSILLFATLFIVLLFQPRKDRY